MADSGSSVLLRRHRSSNFKTSEIFSLLQDVLLHKDILLSLPSQKYYMGRKNQIWSSIANKLSLLTSKERTASQVKTKWRDLSSMGMAALQNQTRTRMAKNDPPYMPLIFAILNATKMKKPQRRGSFHEQEGNSFNGDSTCIPADCDGLDAASLTEGFDPSQTENLGQAASLSANAVDLEVPCNSSQSNEAVTSQQMDVTAELPAATCLPKVECEVELPPDISSLLDDGFQLEVVVDEKPQEIKSEEPSLLTGALQQLSQTLISQAALSRPSPDISALFEEQAIKKPLKRKKSDESLQLTVALQKLSQVAVSQPSTAMRPGEEQQGSPKPASVHQPSPKPAEALATRTQQQQPPLTPLLTASSIISPHQATCPPTQKPHQATCLPTQKPHQATCPPTQKPHQATCSPVQQKCQALCSPTQEVPAKMQAYQHTQPPDFVFSQEYACRIPLPMKMMKMRMLRNHYLARRNANNRGQTNALSDNDLWKRWLKSETELCVQKTKTLEKKIELMELKIELKNKYLDRKLKLKAMDEKGRILEEEDGKGS